MTGISNPRPSRLTLLLLLLVGCWTGPSWAASLTGTVVGVHDGDTLTLLTPEQSTVKVRLTQIDAPESGQPYGKAAKAALSDLVFQRQVVVTSAGGDRYGRTLGAVSVGGQDVARQLLATGAVWAYRQYLTDPSLIAVEDQARAGGRGLWALPVGQRVPPWEWRRSN